MRGNFQRYTSQADGHCSSAACRTWFPGSPGLFVRTHDLLKEKNQSHLFLRSLSDRPVIVHSEGDQSEHGYVETDVPPGIGALDIVLVSKSA